MPGRKVQCVRRKAKWSSDVSLWRHLSANGVFCSSYNYLFACNQSLLKCDWSIQQWLQTPKTLWHQTTCSVQTDSPSSPSGFCLQRQQNFLFFSFTFQLKLFFISWPELKLLTWVKILKLIKHLLEPLLNPESTDGAQALEGGRKVGEDRTPSCKTCKQSTVSSETK